MPRAAAVVLQHVGKRYRRSLGGPRVTTLKSYLTHDLLRKKNFWPNTSDIQPINLQPQAWALRDISFQVPKGQTLGMIGRNGSGKSTLLKLLGRILSPDDGELHIDGKVAALIELGAGFHPELTGKENIIINGVIMGLSKKQMRERMAAIIDFAEAQSFIDQPVRTYSSGMYARLGFSVAMHVDADILLIDEVLSVGDATFNIKCRRALDAMRQVGKSIIVVSHDLNTIANWCDEAVWLDQGTVIQKGAARDVVQSYQQRFESETTPVMEI